MYRVRYDLKPKAKPSGRVKAVVNAIHDYLQLVRAAIDAHQRSDSPSNLSEADAKKKERSRKYGPIFDWKSPTVEAKRQVVARELDNFRTIFAPEDDLKAKQREVLRHMQFIPMHHSAFGSIRHRNPRLCAQAHLTYWGTTEPAQLVLLNLDVKNFFPSVTSSLVRTALEAHGFDEERIDYILEVAMTYPNTSVLSSVFTGLRQLAGSLRDQFPASSRGVFESNLDESLQFCRSNSSRKNCRTLIAHVCAVLLNVENFDDEEMFLPQGSPASPLLANLAMKQADYRIIAGAQHYGAYYTRYVDDLVFSWKGRQKGKTIDSLYRLTRTILGDLGLKINIAKKEVKGTGARQDVVGFCINSGHVTVNKAYRRRVRAMLHNAEVRTEVLSAEEVYKIRGMINHISVTHPELAQSMLQKLDRISLNSERRIVHEEQQDVAIEIGTHRQLNVE